jgi:hypothetical protein
MFYDESNLLFKVIHKLINKKSKSLVFNGNVNEIDNKITEFNDCIIFEDEDYYTFYLSKDEKIYINEEGLCIESKNKLDGDYIEKIIRNPFMYFE